VRASARRGAAVGGYLHGHAQGMRERRQKGGDGGGWEAREWKANEKTFFFLFSPSCPPQGPNGTMASLRSGVLLIVGPAVVRQWFPPYIPT
jgi:hypothetical protein